MHGNVQKEAKNKKMEAQPNNKTSVGQLILVPYENKILKLFLQQKVI